MKHIDAETIHSMLDYPGLVVALKEIFTSGVNVNKRYAMSEPVSDERHNDWILLPAWQFGRYKGIKIVSVHPDNEKRGLPSVQGLYVLFDGVTGAPLVTIDGAALTLRKTAANSALASELLSRQDSSVLLMVGAGALAVPLICAHSAVRKIEKVLIWNRTEPRARLVASQLGTKIKASVEVVSDLKKAVKQADIICCATMATKPLVSGKWLKAGAHLDLVGGYRPDMREADDDAVKKARVFVDNKSTTVKEAGDLTQPIAKGILKESMISDLAQLTRGLRPGRLKESDITLFKSGGGANEDLATAQYLLQKLDVPAARWARAVEVTD